MIWLYSGGDIFESSPKHWLSWTGFLVVFLSSGNFLESTLNQATTVSLNLAAVKHTTIQVTRQPL
jgi:hypothetical protein